MNCLVVLGAFMNAYFNESSRLWVKNSATTFVRREIQRLKV